MRCAPALIALLLAACTTVPADPAPIRYVDAHSHLLDEIGPGEEIAMFKTAGLAGVVIMHPDVPALQAVAQANPGYIVPFISLARLPQMTGLRLTGTSSETISELWRSGRACGFGEIPTRIIPRTEPSDELTLLNPDRLKIYADADRLGVPVNMHIDIASPAVAAAIAQIARDYPHARFILAHAGWSASAETIATMMAAHPNLYADLSVRLDPAEGLAVEPYTPGSQPPGAVDVISILDVDGQIRSEWRGVLRRFPERFMFGMDVTQRERPKHMTELVAIARKALSSLGPRIENAIAHGNVERLIAGCRAGLAR